jgi:hypothetical protein
VVCADAGTVIDSTPSATIAPTTLVHFNKII